MTARTKIVLVDRWQRYRKQTRKGGIHNRKWRPLMVPVESRLIMGAEAALLASTLSPLPYARVLEFTPKLWAWVQRRYPAFVGKCDVFRRVERLDPLFGTVLEDEALTPAPAAPPPQSRPSPLSAGSA